MYNRNLHGVAVNSTFMQLTPAMDAALSAIEGPNNLSASSRFALLVYDLNGGGGGTSGNTTMQEQQYSQIVVESGNVTYLMESIPGTGTSADAVWRIRRITETSANGRTYTEWADGDTNFDNIAANYATLSYSF